MVSFEIIAQTFGGIFQFIILGALFGVLAVMAYVAYSAGLLVKRKYRLILFAPRGSGYRVFMPHGRFLKSGKFEIYYGLFDMKKVEAPNERAIGEGDIIFGYSPSKDNVFWIEEIGVNETKIKADPTLSEAMKLAYANMVEDDVARYTKQSPYAQYVPYMGLIAGFIIVAVALWLATGHISESLDNVANKFAAVGNKLANATIVIEKPATPSQAPSQTYNIPSINPNAPPG